MVSVEVRREQKRLANRRWMKNHPGRAAQVAERYRDKNPHMYAISRRKWLYMLMMILKYYQEQVFEEAWS